MTTQTTCMTTSDVLLKPKALNGAALMTRRDFIKSAIACAAVSLVPPLDLVNVRILDTLVINYREQMRAYIAQWHQIQMDDLTLKYLAGVPYGTTA